MEEMGQGESLTEGTAPVAGVDEKPHDSIDARTRSSTPSVRRLSRTALMEAAGRNSTLEQAIEAGKVADWMPIDEPNFN